MLYDIKKRRLELGLTAAEVAEAVGVSTPTVTRWESGRISNMKRDKIEKLAEVLVISPYTLLSDPDKGIADTTPERMGKYAEYFEAMTKHPRICDLIKVAELATEDEIDIAISMLDKLIRLREGK